MSNIGQLILENDTAIEALYAVNAAMPKEMAYLQGQPEKPYDNAVYPDTQEPVVTLSRTITDDYHPELDRTGYGLILMHALLKGDKEALSSLSDASFEDLQQYLYESIKNADAPDEQFSGNAIPSERIDSEKLTSLVTLLTIHDLGKMKNFQNLVEEKTSKYGFTISAADHDDLLFKLLKGAPEAMLAEIVPSYAALNQEQRNDVLGALVGGVNPGRIFQLEGTPGEFSGVVQDDDVPVNPSFYRAFHTLDMASIRGHLYALEGEPMKTANGKDAHVFWNDFIHKFMPNIFLLAGKVASAEMTPVQAYDEVLQGRAEQFGFDVTQPAGRAATRLRAMYRGDIENKDIEAFLKDNQGDNSWRQNLVRELNINGDTAFQPSIAIGYAPDASQQISQSELSETEAFQIWAKGLNDTFVRVRAAIKGHHVNELSLNASGQGQVTVEIQGLLEHLESTPDLLSSESYQLDLKGGRFAAKALDVHDSSQPPLEP